MHLSTNKRRKEIHKFALNQASQNNEAACTFQQKKRRKEIHKFALNQARQNNEAACTFQQKKEEKKYTYKTDNLWCHFLKKLNEK